MKITDFLSDVGRPVAYFPKLRCITGSINATLFLCQLLYWEGKQECKNGWVYKSHADMEEETGLSRREQELVRKTLKDAGFIEEKLAGLPRTLHYRVVKDVINAAWDNHIATLEEESTVSQNDSLCDQKVHTISQNDTACPQKGHTYATKRDIHMSPKGTSITENTTENTTETTIGAPHNVEEEEKDSILTDEEETGLPKTKKPRGESTMWDKPSKYVEDNKNLGEKESTDLVADAIYGMMSDVSRRTVSKKKPARNSKTILALFKAESNRLFGGCVPFETGKDMKLLRTMIDELGYDTTLEMMNWMFRNWAEFNRECKLRPGLPTIGMFWGFRAYLMEKILLVSDDKVTMQGEKIDENRF